jgi:type IV secretion system protein VirD4
MLTFIFDTYAASDLIIYSGIPLLFIATPLAVLAAAYLLGTGGQKTLEGGMSHRQRRIAAATQLFAALAVMNASLLVTRHLALKPGSITTTNFALDVLFGPPVYSRERLALAGGITLVVGALGAVVVREQIRAGGPVREFADRLRDPIRRREEHGSAHFCRPGEYVHLAKPREGGLVILGAFYGERGGSTRRQFYRLDAGPNRGLYEGKGVTLGVEDQARGIVVIGPPGSGKSQAVILPAIAESMRNGQSCIVVDPQGELIGWILKFAAVTGHLVAIHDPTDPTLSRFNLAQNVGSVADAQAIAQVMVSPPGSSRGGGDSAFWTKAAQNLLAGALLRYNSLGDILVNLVDIDAIAGRLNEAEDEARILCGDFIHSALHTRDQKLALNTAASLKNTNLANWAAPDIRAATSACDFTARTIVERPGVIVLRCPGRYRDVYGPYLGAVIQKLMQDLDTLGEEHGGPLPRPVKIVLDEFPALGRLGSVVSAVNLVRKRQISFVIAAQTLAQLEMIYGRAGADALLSGMATQIYFGSCDAATAKYVSQNLGKTTERVKRDAPRPGQTDTYRRQRDLLAPDEVIAPPRGNCTFLYRYATETYATQIVMLAYLTRMYERPDWTRSIADAEARGQKPFLLGQGQELSLEPVSAASLFGSIPSKEEVSIEKDGGKENRERDLPPPGSNSAPHNYNLGGW